MFRRNFIQNLTLGSASAAVARAGKTSASVEFHVAGFTCITCAVGLETLLRQQKGILRVEASYPKTTVLIEFDPSAVTREMLREYVSEMGFRADEIKRP